MRQQLLNFLKALEFSVPPPADCHHAITYAQFGSDDSGWSDRLALQLNRGGTFICFFLEDGDLEKPPSALVSEIIEQLK